jgi:putative membrane protein
MNGDMITATKEPKAGIDVSTALALERTYLAIERTLMGWIRTALSMIGFGFTIGKLGQVLDDVRVKGPLGNIRPVSVKQIACLLVVLGTVALPFSIGAECANST